LTTAYRIEKLTGYAVDVYEARDRPGGRVYTVRMGNSYEELGGKSIADGGEATNIRFLIEEMGLKMETCTIDFAHRKCYYKGKSTPYYKAYLEGPLPDQQLYRQVLNWSQNSTNMAEILDRLFAHYPLLRQISEVRMRAYEGNDAKDLSLAYLEGFWDYFLSGYNFAHHKQTMDYQLESIEGGNSLLIEKLTAALRRPIHFHAPLRKITKTPEGKISLQFDNLNEVLTDYLVLAIPCSTLQKVEIQEGLLAKDQKEAIHTLQYGTNSKILVPVANIPENPPMFSLTDTMTT